MIPASSPHSAAAAPDLARELDQKFQAWRERCGELPGHIAERRALLARRQSRLACWARRNSRALMAAAIFLALVASEFALLLKYLDLLQRAGV